MELWLFLQAHTGGSGLIEQTKTNQIADAGGRPRKTSQTTFFLDVRPGLNLRGGVSAPRP
jgi:hypothetical protein